MCGIAGFFGARAVSIGTIERMLNALRPRGPDAESAVLWSAELKSTEAPAPNGLLSTRLSIIDPRPDANQPMANAAGDVWIAYNGEVYDWAADAKTLREAGFLFRTHSDTEFILHAYEHWGLGSIERLRGMFALAILDLRQRALYVVRDRFGLKPVVYAHGPQGFAFASTVRALLPWLPAGSRQFSAESIDAFLAHRTIPAPRTVFAGIRRLPAAHYLRYDLASGSLTAQEYWRLEAATDPWLPTLDAAIEMRTVADRPLGLFLSSGIDSSVVACRLASMGHPGLQTFTAGFPGTDFDESADARVTAARLGLPHLSVTISESIVDDFPRLVADLDEPFADPSSVPMWQLSREATRHVKVVLGGDGGDELFGGYKRYGKHLRTRWRRGVILPWLKPSATSAGRGWQRAAEELRLDWRSAYVLRFSGLSPRQRGFLQPDFAPQPHYWRMPADAGRTDLETLLEIDRLNYLPEYILRKDDLCTMAHGLELRAPFLDHRFAACVMGVPPALRFTTPAKLFLAPALAPIADLGLFARKKRGFNPPIDGWLRGDLAPRLDRLGERLSALSAGQLSQPNVDRFVAAWRGDARHLGEQLLQLLILDESLRQLTDLAAQP